MHVREGGREGGREEASERARELVWERVSEQARELGIKWLRAGGMEGREGGSRGTGTEERVGRI